MIKIKHATNKINATINISGSKSESNRWLIIDKLSPESLIIHNLSNAQDTITLQKSLESENEEINVGDAGTCMRFLTSFFVIQSNRKVVLTGSERMLERPIGALVNALNSLGGSITYLDKKGYPPLLIKGKILQKNYVNIQANVSSQFITSLMLVAPFLPNGLNIHLDGELTSRPYIEMTKKHLETIGVQVFWKKNEITIKPIKNIKNKPIYVESDWSSASYWYSILALNDEETSEIKLTTFIHKSLQGDSIVADIYNKYFGIKTKYEKNILYLSKIKDFTPPDYLLLDLNNSPDIAQTIIITAAALGMKAKLTGLHTLNIKETNRLVALHRELKKIGVYTELKEDSIEIIAIEKIEKMQYIETYKDHRMAMSFAPLALKFPIIIDDENVVKKSYPHFWNDLKKADFQISQL